MKIYHSTLLIITLMILAPLVSAQNLPKFINISDDKTVVTTASGDVTGFYNESKLRQIYLTFEETDFWTQLEDNYDTENYVKATLSYKDETLHDVGVQFKGNTSYTRLSDDAEKMSFSIKTDLFVDDQDLDGYSNINLNNAYEDPSTMREVIYAHLCRNHIPAPQANFVELYINGEYWGPYANVQQVNKDLLEEWFFSNDGARFRADAATSTTSGGGGNGGGPGGGGGGGANWGDGTAAINYLGADTATYQEYYTLKSSDIDSSWQKLVSFCDILNNTPIDDLEATLKDYLDIDRTLWFLAHEIIYSDDDSYVYKGKQDYYVYYEPESGRFTPLEFDGNSALHLQNANWDIFMNEDNENYPLLNRLLSIPSIRQRYLAHVRTIINEEMNLDEVSGLIDRYATLIDSSIQADPKKLMTYAEYTSGVVELKEYFTTRKSFLESDTEVNVTSVDISEVTYSAHDIAGARPYEGEVMNITLDLGIQEAAEVNLYYSIGFIGNFTKLTMLDDGSSNDGGAEDGVYGINIPAQSEGIYVRYYIEAIANDASETASFLPVGTEHSSYIYQVQYNSLENPPLVINEILASNDDIIADEAGEYDDYIELYNSSTESIALAGYFLTDDIEELNQYALPDISLEAGDYYLVWADGDEEQGVNHANFKLNADGDDLLLINAEDEIVDVLSFTNQKTDISLGRTPNGSGDFAFMTPTPMAENGEEVTILATSEALEIQSFSLYPNPASSVLTITGSTNQKLEIYSLTGNRIHSTLLVNESTAIDVSRWQKGVYLVKLDNQVNRLIVR